MNTKISVHGAILAMTFVFLSSSGMAQTNCDPKVEACLIAGNDYFIQRQSSGADTYLNGKDPKHDFRIAFWANVVKPIANKKAGDSCNFVDGARVRVVQRFKDSDGYLVKYLGGADADDACPVGSYTHVSGMPLLAFKTTKNIEDEARRILGSQKK